MQFAAGAGEDCMFLRMSDGTCRVFLGTCLQKDELGDSKSCLPKSRFYMHTNWKAITFWWCGAMIFHCNIFLKTNQAEWNRWQQYKISSVENIRVKLYLLTEVIRSFRKCHHVLISKLKSWAAAMVSEHVFDMLYRNICLCINVITLKQVLPWFSFSRSCSYTALLLSIGLVYNKASKYV